MIGPLLKVAFITIFVICSIHCERHSIGWTSDWKKKTGCLFNGNVCAQHEWCFDDHAFGKCIPNYNNGEGEYTYKLMMDNLLILQEDMKFLYRNGYGWPHPFTQCILKQRLKLIKYSRPVDISICNPFSRLPDRSRQNDNGDFADFSDVYINPDDIERDHEFYSDLNDDYHRSVINRNKLQGTPLYLPWMQGVKQQQYEDDQVPLAYGQPRFRPDYNTPERFRAGEEMKDKMDVEWKELRHMDMISKGLENPNKAYTEGGLVFLPRKGANGEEDDEMFSDFIKSYDPELGWGFKRPERLDVKKPGPFYKTNNFAFEINDEGAEQKQGEEIPKTVDATTLLGTNRKSDSEETKSTNTNNKASSKLTQDDFKTVYISKIAPGEEKDIQRKENSKNKMLDVDNDQYEVVDTSYVSIQIKQKISSPDRGNNLLKVLSNIINIDFKSIVNARFDESEITFQILPSAGVNASQVVKRIETMKSKFAKKTGYTIESVSVGDKVKTPSVMMSSKYEDSKNFEWIFISVAAVCAVLVSVAAFVVMRKHAKYKSKFEGLIGSSTEVSKDYQELCRARMSSKKEETNATSQRIASLSKDPDNSPSSRSSTSSWGEEPVLSNMDISTGHMVLAYMEDHLNNKNRLDSEWAALCAYEAEPCAVNVARKPENAKKNRYINALPYDHARVVINEYANMNNSDYINASTITDHDPRNPAYIATQGPLPDTSADFWQMVWEQGCVVIVMLTRLVENDVVLCHRYWPEEGSELYHIYEVHLVSEHIWCDDYLVRSFYLKNLKTGETRTVTQFHFLTWPDGGVPNTTKALLEFRRKVNKSFRGRSCPIVVHCSDGVSRTGSYCLLDMVLNRMAKGAKEIDIAATLEHIRDQRSGAVATKAQFQMVLAAVAEEVQAILKALPQQQTPQPLPPPPPPAQH
ncbi:receptor-type tyrosine-protein phosphatase N2 isoform X2 [Sipha flava]|uniref:Receptor-type tyrosine-protein phosphatase N2 isoform X2 n=1 Tax=Sipha flava TaxID=143950 RepID=A0A8B8FJM6_9HEMI|nr:receptor-type tyrosine-protein phosphatase N2 isoform X2 [Sipha flava]